VKHDPSETPKRTRALSKNELARKIEKLEREKIVIEERERRKDGEMEAERMRTKAIVDELNNRTAQQRSFIDGLLRKPIHTNIPLWSILYPATTSNGALSQFWFGMDNFAAFSNEVFEYVQSSSYLSSYQYPTELLAYLLVFLRKGFEFILMEKMLLSYRSDSTLKGVSDSLLFCYLRSSAFYGYSYEVETLG
jgi:hypothetical protein